MSYSKPQWKSQELANCISPKLSVDAAKLSLKLCNYQWDPKKQAYVIKDEAQKILEKLNKDVNWSKAIPAITDQYSEKIEPKE